MGEFRENNLKDLREQFNDVDEKYRIMYDSQFLKKFKDVFAYEYREMMIKRFHFDYSDDENLIIKFKPKEKEIPSYFKADNNHMHIKKISSSYCTLRTANKNKKYGRGRIKKKNSPPLYLTIT